MANSDTSSNKIDHDTINNSRQRLVKEVSSLGEKARKGGFRHSIRLMRQCEFVEYDHDKVTLKLKPETISGLLSNLRLAANMRRIQSFASKLPEDKKKVLDEIFGPEFCWLTHCNVDFCEYDAAKLELFLNHTLDVIATQQRHKFDTDLKFASFLDYCRTAANPSTEEGT